MEWKVALEIVNPSGDFYDILLVWHFNVEKYQKIYRSKQTGRLIKEEGILSSSNHKSMDYGQLIVVRHDSRSPLMHTQVLIKGKVYWSLEVVGQSSKGNR